MLKPRAPKEALGITTSSRLVLVHPEHKNARVPAAAIHEWSDTTATRIGTTRADDLWIEETLPGHADWIMASRVIGDERGVPVIAEVRIFPNGEQPDHGEWSAELLGCAARPVPRGGISATLLRHHAARAVKHHTRTASCLAWSSHNSLLSVISDPALRDGLERTEAIIEKAGIRHTDPFAKLQAGLQSKTRAGSKRGRPEKWTVADLARIGLTYNIARREGRHPIPAIVKAESSRQNKITAAQARNLVARARRHGFIREATKQGRASESLSDTELAKLRTLAMKEGKRTRRQAGRRRAIRSNLTG